MKDLIGNCRREVGYLHAESVVPFHDWLRELVEHALLSLRRRNLRRVPRLRIFSENGTRDDFTSEFLNSPVSTDSLECSLRALWPVDCCAAINDIGCWSTQIHEYVRDNFLATWIDEFGPSLGGVDVYAFIGAYSATPFGVHKDDEDSYLYNLGPNEKTVHVWLPADLVACFGSDALRRPVFNYRPGLSRAATIVIKPGDGLLICRGHYHVLESPKYTVMLGIAPYLFDSNAFLAKAVTRAVRCANGKTSEVHYGCDLDALASLLHGVSQESLSTESLGIALKAEVLRLRSNNYVLNPNACAENVAVDSSTRFRLLHADYLQAIKMGEQLHVFARGHELVLDQVEVVALLLDRIWVGAVFSVEELIQVVDGRLTQLAAIALMRSLLDCGAIGVADIS